MKTKMLKWLKALVEYATIAGTVLGCAYICVSSQYNEDYTEKTLLLWLIGLLGLLATSMVAERFFKLEKIAKTVDDIKNIEEDDRDGIKVIKRLQVEHLTTRFKDAKSMVITGGSLNRISDELYGFFEEKFKADRSCKLEVMMVKPYSPAADLLCANVVYETDDCEQYSQHIEQSLERFMKLKARYPKQITIRQSDKVPPFSLVVTDEKSENATLKVELYSYAVPTHDRIQLIVDRKTNRKEFDFFINQLTTLRENSEEIVC